MHSDIVLLKFVSATFAALPVVRCSSVLLLNPAKNNVIKHQGDSQKAFDIAVHGILFWASMGFLMPVGILLIRFPAKHESQRTRSHKASFYLHAILQACSVVLATAGAVLSIRNFENSFDNCHQRVGLALYAAIYLQIFTGFRRPRRGSRGRCIWYFFHWILGTAVSFVGIFNIFTGLNAYHRKTSRSATLWTILFTVQVSLMAFFYLFQDKWSYIQRQGLSNTENQPIIPASIHQLVNTDPTAIMNKTDPSTTSDQGLQGHRKSNALGTYFSRSNALNKLFQLT